MTKSVGLWIRVSTQQQAESDSPKHHESRGRAFSALKDWEVREVYNLSGVSGKAILDHPETKRMLADVAKGHISGLIFSKLARLGRSTRELIELADYFAKHNADLISLGDSIDTSTPIGRFFFTITAGFGQMEREETADRVKQSVPTRAYEGKSLGGDAPYGYKWVGKQLLLDEKEAPIRKMMFELFLVHKRKMTVSTILNEKGYRTRKGELFNPNLIRRCLEDPIAKGLRRVNYNYSSGERKAGQRIKPESEWIFIEVPAIVTEEIWEQVNKIIKVQRDSVERTGRTNVHLFSGILECQCGSKMYMRSNSPRYICKDYKNCKNQIMPDALENSFKDELKGLLFSEDSLEQQVEQEKEQLRTLKLELQDHKEKIDELQKQITKVLDLYYADKIQKENFDQYHEPLATELKQRQQSYADTQSMIDVLNIDSLNNEYVLKEAQDLYDMWDLFTDEEKKQLIIAITEKIKVEDTRVVIDLKAIPTLYRRPASNVASIQLLTFAPRPTSFELVQKVDDPVVGRKEMTALDFLLTFLSRKK